MKNGSRRRWVAPCALAFAATALVAGCSSSSSGSGSGSGSGGSSGGASSAGVSAAKAQVTKLEATTAKYPVPTAPVSGVSKLKGKTVYYIPLDAHIPAFATAAVAAKAALKKAGLNFTECDGQGNPTAISSCVSQATGAGAAGIILDAAPYQMAANSLNAAKGKGIPIIIADQYDPGAASTDQVAYVQGVVDQPSQIAYWLIASTGGKANAILSEEQDSPSSEAYLQNSLPIYSKDCPACTITVKDITASMTDQQITASVSSNVQSDPAATYYYTEFEDSLQDTVSGLQSAGKTNTVGILTASASVNGLGLIKNGQGVKADVAVDDPYEGWALTDEILRMATKSPVVTETVPSRLFSSDNIGSIQVTAAAQNSGAWFGDNSYQGAFSKLWGVR